MAEAFIGMTISVTLKAPANTEIHGKFVNIASGQTLVLEDVFFPASGRVAQTYQVPGNQIADLEVIQTRQAPPSKLAETPSKSAFSDPAILSYGKSPTAATSTLHEQHQVELPATPSQPSSLSAAVNDLPSIATRPDASKREQPSRAAIPKTRSPERIRQQVEKGAQAEQDKTNGQSQPGKKTRRGKKGAQGPLDTPILPQQTISPDVSRNGYDMNGSVKAKKGWRSTPLLQEHLQDNKAVDATRLTPAFAKKQSKRKQDRQAEQSGWATEDATDIQEMEEFDFEANLSKFDKRTVFDQIRNEDTTADEDRLVSHNRLPARPGTYGGKNLHPTEMVLSPPLKAQQRNSDLASTSDADTELNLDTGRASRQAPSRSMTKRPPGRSNSGMLEDGAIPMNTSITSSALNRSMSSLRGGFVQAASSLANSSPNPNNRGRSPQSVHSPLEALENFHVGPRTSMHQPHFRCRSSRLPCPTLRPERLARLEADQLPSLGISTEEITGNTARAIAASITPMALRPAHSRRNSKTSTDRQGSIGGGTKPVVVILAGNHALGARTIAAARYLYGRDFKVLISITKYETPKLWNPNVAKQIHPLQALGRKAARMEGWRSTSAAIKKLNGPPALIVDALLDGVCYANIRDTELQAEVREMIDWANRSRASVLSVACPSGYDATTGDASLLEGEPVAIRPDRVLALGTPVQGLFEAVKDGEGHAWSVSVADIGINVALRGSEVVPFGSEWVTELDLRGVGGIEEV